MATRGAQFDLGPWTELLRWLKDHARDASGILKTAFLTAGYQNIIDHFKMEMGPDGKWRARAQSTQEMYAAIASGRRRPPKGYARAAFNPSNKLLQLSGQMRKSFLKSNVERLSASSIAFFVNDKKTASHEYGDPSRGIPERSMLWLDNKAKDLMAEIMADLFLKEKKT